MKYLTFGEIMLRLKSPGHECLFQNGTLEATFGGGEANVAVSLANFGVDAAFLTVLPDNPVGSACMGELRRFGVDTSRILTRQGRMGIYFLESGANQRPSKVVYDRAGSAIAQTAPSEIKPLLGSGGSISQASPLPFLKALWSCPFVRSGRPKPGVLPFPAT